eukprot:TRINITY_DN3572_c0_g1_i1.p2 TRINITY_DN3572_c0_g1~~TRINITY_DN3572_c0_g1_i1.p2  ORF type:complete len:386 (-),score=194.26 TRINITY_DN3572_c0_g1_i1:1485-2642(-)
MPSFQLIYHDLPIEIKEGSNVFGRNHLKEKDKRVSRQQVELNLEDGKLTLKRLGLHPIKIMRENGDEEMLEKTGEVRELKANDSFTLLMDEHIFKVERLKEGKKEDVKKEKSKLVEKDDDGWLPKLPKVSNPDNLKRKIEDEEKEDKLPSNSQKEGDEKKLEGDIDKELDQLLEEKNPKKIKINEPELSDEEINPPKEDNKEKENVFDDEEMAKRLQREFDEEEKKEQRNKQLRVSQSDEDFAKNLQKEMEEEEKQRVLRDERIAKELYAKEKKKQKKAQVHSEEEDDEEEEDEVEIKRKYQKRRASRNVNFVDPLADEFSSGSDWDEEQDAYDYPKWGVEGDDNEEDDGSDEDGSDDEDSHKPRCKFGKDCYRTNADHFQKFAH